MILWNFQQKQSLEYCMVVIILGVLTAFAIEVYPKYASIARTTELTYAAHDYEVNLVVDRAMTGRWVVDQPENLKRAKTFDLIKDVAITESGNISFVINANTERTKDKTLDRQTLGFTLYSLENSEGYSFYSWHCGKSTAPMPYRAAELSETSLPGFYTHVICAE